MRIFISAAEASSDAHGAQLLQAIREQWTASHQPDSKSIDVFGIGGPKLQKSGLRAIVDARELLAMGFSEIIGRLPKIFRALDDVTQEVIRNRPDLAIVIDYPDFHFRLAKRFKKIGIPTIYFIPPKVWVWRKRRVEFLRRYFAKILCILPFEEEFYRQYNISAKYVGNPLVDELPLSLSQSEARRKLQLAVTDRVFVMMPGSRPSELKAHLELMIKSIIQATQELRKSGFLKPTELIRVLMPFPLTSDLSSIQTRVKVFNQTLSDLGIDLQISQGNAAECLVAADAGLIKSGTSTLEAGLLRCPHAIVYKTTATTAWIFKYLIRYKGPVGLVNLVTGWKPGDPYLVKEILLEKVTQESLSSEIIALLTDQDYQKKLASGFETLRERVFSQKSPSQTAAAEILEFYLKLKKG